MTTTFYGKGVAIAGMKTSCGATLIASQFTDTVQFGGGGSVAPSSTQTKVAPIASGSPNSAATKSGAEAASELTSEGSNTGAAGVVFDEQYLLQDEEGNILANMPYTVKLPSGELVHGTTDEEGRTKRYATEQAEELEVFAGHA